jgi:circadian clock protein KaiC
LSRVKALEERETIIRKVSLEELITPRIELKMVPTGIRGLDKILQGGFPEGAVALLAGNPGTGKSTFAAKFIYEGCLRGEPGVYLNFVEPKGDFYQHMRMLGMDLEACERKGLFQYIEAVTIADEEALVSQLEDLVKIVLTKKVKRLAIDSISAMLQIVKSPSRVRELLQNIFVNTLKPTGVTSILIAEHPYGARVVGYGIEEFVVDAVFILRFRLLRGKIHRIIEIRKARWAPIHQAEFTFHIRPGTVIEISLPEEPEEIPSPDYSEIINLCNIVGGIPCEVEGVEEQKLDSICRFFDMPRGSQILVGVSSTTSTMLILAGLAASLMASGHGGIFVLSFKNSSESIADLIQAILSYHPVKNSEKVSTMSINPTAYTLPELVDMVTEIIAKFKPKVFLLEGLEAIEVVEEKKERYYSSLYNMLMRSKRARTTSFYLYSVPSRSHLRDLPITPLFDAILYVESNPRSIIEYSYSGTALEVNLDIHHPFTHVRIPLLCRMKESLTEKLVKVKYGFKGNTPKPSAAR